MMRSTAITVLFALPAFADKASIDRQIVDMVRNNSVLRVFQGEIEDTIPQLDEYGCWCYFYDNVGRGKGQPVDEVDSLCKILHDGYECAIRDAEAMDLECVPWDATYQPGVKGAGLYDSCVANNPGDQCAAYSCTVEGQFVSSLVAALLNSVAVNYDTYSHANGFDPATDKGCPVRKGTPGASNEKACCGSYPNRYPYKTLDGERSCCKSRTFNTNLLTCCPNGQVKADC